MRFLNRAPVELPLYNCFGGCIATVGRRYRPRLEAGAGGQELRVGERIEFCAQVIGGGHDGPSSVAVVVVWARTAVSRGVRNRRIVRKRFPRGVVGRRKGETMPLYLSRFSYTPETWARLIGQPEDRREAARSYVESVGGQLHGFWYAFGTHDGFSLWEAPDNVSMAAVALAIAGGGALSGLETTVLLTVDETLDALRKAGQIQYRPPGA